MAAYKLIASDLDGTLLRNDQSLSNENAQAIAEMAQQGVVFALSTGRTYTEILPQLRENPHIRWYLCSDGGLIYDKQEDKSYTALIQGGLQKQVLDILFACDCLFTAHFNGVSYYDAQRTSPADFAHCNVSDYFQQLIAECDQAAGDFRDFCYRMDGIEQITAFFHSEQALVRCREALRSTGLVETAWTPPCYMELYHTSAGKGRALLKLAEILGIPPEQTIAIGDTANDISIIRAAGLGLATANAKQALKDVADAVICSNEEHVAQYALTHYL